MWQSAGSGPIKATVKAGLTDCSQLSPGQHLFGQGAHKVKGVAKGHLGSQRYKLVGISGTRKNCWGQSPPSPETFLLG